VKSREETGGKISTFMSCPDQSQGEERQAHVHSQGKFVRWMEIFLENDKGENQDIPFLPLPLSSLYLNDVLVH
jgi:hypothetical protein